MRWAIRKESSYSLERYIFRICAAVVTLVRLRFTPFLCRGNEDVKMFQAQGQPHAGQHLEFLATKIFQSCFVHHVASGAEGVDG